MDSRQYLMFYEAVAADGGRSIGLAVSKDGLSGWKRYDKPVMQPSAEEGSWDSGSMGAPCAVSMSAGRWRLYYGGRAGRETGAGVRRGHNGIQKGNTPHAKGKGTGRDGWAGKVGGMRKGQVSGPFVLPLH